MDKVEQVCMSLDKNLYKCYEYGITDSCTHDLTERIFWGRVEKVYLNACTYHLEHLLNNSNWEEVK